MLPVINEIYLYPLYTYNFYAYYIYIYIYSYQNLTLNPVKNFLGNIQVLRWAMSAIYTHYRGNYGWHMLRLLTETSHNAAHNI